MKHVDTSIEQVLSFSRVTSNGFIPLRKSVLTHLGTGAPRLTVDDEVTLTADQTTGTAVELDGTRMAATEQLSHLLEIVPDTTLAFITRGPDLAVKRVVLQESTGAFPGISDSETPTTLTRTCITNPPPEALLAQLREAARELAPKSDPLDAMASGATLPGWLARQLRGEPAPDDDALKDRLIRRYVDEQHDDGSWNGSVVVTARALRDLAALGESGDNDSVRRGVDWLIRRPESRHNPGQWFGTDDLVAEQASVVTSRDAGKGGRFRAVKASEKKHIMQGDSLIHAPCGPRIMWPNALVVEALVGLGYEKHPRVQSALNTLTMREWCECAYQHGTSDWRDAVPAPAELVASYEEHCRQRFHYGGYSDPAWLIGKDAPTRVGQRPEPDSFTVAMPDHVQGCEFITTRALAGVQDPRVQMFAAAHLWRFAAIQRADGTFPAERYGAGFGLVGLLEAASRYDHPASAIMLLRALPRIVEIQNDDGSWGDGASRDWETLAVMRILRHPAFPG